FFRAPLFVPADRSDRFEKAASTEADAVILDLEDAVAAVAKAQARAALRVGFSEKPIIVRINSASSAHHAEDLAAVTPLDFAAVILAKTETAAEAEAVAAATGKPVIALIESALGLANARQI